MPTITDLQRRLETFRKAGEVSPDERIDFLSDVEQVQDSLSELSDGIAEVPDAEPPEGKPHVPDKDKEQDGRIRAVEVRVNKLEAEPEQEDEPEPDDEPKS